MKPVPNRWSIRKDLKKKQWNVLVDNKILVSFDSWEECRALVSYQVRVRPHVEKSSRGAVTMIFDIVMLLMGVSTGIVCIYFGWLTLLPIPLVFLLIAIRGFILQDWHHVSTRPRYRKVGSK